MAVNKYSSVITVLLVIIILVIIASVGLIVYNTVGKTEESQETGTAMAKGDSVKLGGEKSKNGGNGDLLEIDGPEGPTGNRTSDKTSGDGNMPQKRYYQEYVTVGTIEIPKTGIKLPILERGTDKALEVSVAIMYPDDAILKLNTPGNVVIMGHNYRNGKFFSDNKKLTIGDKITISSYTDKLTYTIYEIFETTPGDTRFISRDTQGKREISLSTCTDDGAKRLIIQASAD